MADERDLVDLADELSRRLAASREPPRERGPIVPEKGSGARQADYPPRALDDEALRSGRRDIRSALAARSGHSGSARKDPPPITGDWITTALVLVAVVIGAFRLFAGI